MANFKKLLLSLLVLIMCLSACVCLAEETAAKLPEVGDTIAGFVVTGLDRIDYLATDVVYMQHEKTGANLVYFANDDLERSFSIGFRTNAENNKGLPHVFEHSVLSGSEKYPDPNLTDSIINQTYSTYVNAITYPTATLYPCASLSEDQLYQLVDFYMSGVTEPLLLSDERAMKREAYNYSLESADADIAVSGVVYSEMKGGLADPSSMVVYHLMEQLYPGSVCTNVNGGVPSDILTITWEELKDFHERYYHPSNALITLYGELDLERFLTLIDGDYLSKYERREIVIDDPGYEPYEGYREQIYDAPVSAQTSAENTSYICYGIAMNGMDATETELSSVVASAFNLESSPLQKLALERMPGVVVQASVIDYTPAPMMYFYALYTDAEDKETFLEIVNDAIQQVAQDGIDENIYDMLVNSIKADQLMSGESNNIGVGLAKDFTSSWSYEGDVERAMDGLKMTLNVGSYAESGAIDAIVDKYLVNPTQTALAITRSVPGLQEENDAAFAQALADRKAAMSEDEIAALVQATADFNAWTEANNQNSLIDEIKVVDAQSLPEEAQEATASDVTIDGIRSITSIVEEEGMVMPGILFDASHIPQDRLLDYMLYTMLLGELETEQYSREELESRIGILCDDIGFSASYLQREDDDTVHPYFEVYWDALSENLEESYALVEEILFHTDFSDLTYIRSILNQWKENLKTNTAASARTLARSLGYAAVDEDRLYSHSIGSLNQIEYIESICAMSDDQLAEVMNGMTEIRDLLLNRNGIVLYCVSSEDVVPASDALGRELAAKLDDTAHEPVVYSFDPLPKSIAVIVDGDVQYNAIVAAMPEDTEDDGCYLAMNQLVKDRILTPYLRYEKSAYGVVSGLNEDFIYVVSYRDPNFETTRAHYQQLGDAIRGLELTQSDIDGYITTAYSDLAMPVGSYTLAHEAIGRQLDGEDEVGVGETLRKMQQLKQFTPDDALQMADLYDMLAQEGASVTVGSRAVIEANRELFDVVYTTLVDDVEAEEGEVLEPAA